MSTKKELLTVPEVASMLGIPESTLYDHARKTGEVSGVPVVRVGRRVYIPRTKLMDAIYPPVSGFGIKHIEVHQEHVLKDIIYALKELDMHFVIESTTKPLVESDHPHRRVKRYRVIYGFDPIEGVS